MNPTIFPECNTEFLPPEGLDESQCMTMPVALTSVKGGNLDGVSLTVVAWQPSESELKDLNEGKPIFISMIGGLAPHCVGTSYNYVTFNQ